MLPGAKILRLWNSRAAMWVLCRWWMGRGNRANVVTRSFNTWRQRVLQWSRRSEPSRRFWFLERLDFLQPAWTIGSAFLATFQPTASAWPKWAWPHANAWRLRIRWKSMRRNWSSCFRRSSPRVQAYDEIPDISGHHSAVGDLRLLMNELVILGCAWTGGASGGRAKP